jgi:SecD/SecF fusion protein
LETFIDRENHTGGSIISSQKVGPSIADDIKVSAIWSVVLALIAIGLYILLRFRNIAYWTHRYAHARQMGILVSFR